ncbi:MAG: hybrid sensor histidine kinase/response regulator [Aquabacterium sp.]|nr:MAG: hybrid sensor histidine kinase/response regulator [Aquabacterium sp.]
MIEIRTRPQAPTQPQARLPRIFLPLLVLGALATAVMWRSELHSGMLTPWNVLALPVLVGSMLGSAVLIWLRRQWINQVLGFNGIVLTAYFQGAIYEAIHLHDHADLYSMASLAQFMPVLYVTLFVLLTRHAALVCWLVYSLVAAQCLWGISSSAAAGQTPIVRQMLTAILVAHPCYILGLSFMTHLRQMVAQAQNEAVMAKERFLAMVSHEIRSPLQAMVSSLDLLEIAPDGPTAAKATGRMRASAAMLEAQIRDLTAFTRLETDPTLLPAAVDLRSLLAGLRDEYLPAARARGIELQLLCEGELAPVMADQARLHQVIANLVSNALKYTAAGSVTIQVRRDEREQTVIAVSDTGRGMEAAQIEPAFEPFVRLPSPSGERIEGSGLGLAVVRQLVGLMGGRIRVDSRPGSGTRIEIVLPLAAAPQAVGEDSRLPASVLLVDDAPDILAALSDLLRGAGIADCETARGGVQGLQRAHTRHYDLILLDLQMPDLDGYEVALGIRESGPNRHTPIVAVSAATPERSRPGHEAFDAFIAKPVQHRELAEVVQRFG